MRTSIYQWSVAAITGFCIAAFMGASASASLNLSLDSGNGTFVLLSSVASGTATSVSGSQSGIGYTFLAGTSNSPGASPQATLNISSLTITNGSGAAQTVRVLVGDTGFTFPPVGPVQLASGFGGSITQTLVNSVSFQTWLDDTNAQDGMAGITSGLISFDTSSLSNGDSYNDSNVVSGNIGTTPFSLTGLITMELAAGAVVNFSSSAVASVPEATSILVWGTLALVGAGFRSRRGQRS